MTTLPAPGEISQQKTAAAQQVLYENQRDVIAEMPGGFTSSTLTIAGGVIDPATGYHRVETEALAAADDLTQINFTNLTDEGRLLALLSVDAARVVTVISGGNIDLGSGGPFALDPVYPALFQRVGTRWAVLSRPASQTVVSGPVVVETLTALNSPSLNFITGIDGTANRYEIELLGLVLQTDGEALWLRTSSNGGSSWDSAGGDYTYHMAERDSNAVASTYASATTPTGDTKIALTPAASNNAVKGISGRIEALNLADAALMTTFNVATMCGRPSNNNLTGYQGIGDRFQSAAHNGLQLIPSNGQIVSGRARLWKWVP